MDERERGEVPAAGDCCIDAHPASPASPTMMMMIMIMMIMMMMTPIRPRPTTVVKVPGPSLMIIYDLVFDVVNEDDNVLRLIRHKTHQTLLRGSKTPV